MKTLRKTTTLPQRGDGDPRARINSEFDPPPTAITLSSPMATPGVEQELEVDMATSENLPWMCIVWDDPVNLMSYVTYVFQTVLGYDKKRAMELMMQVHTEDKAAVSSGEKDKVEAGFEGGGGFTGGGVSGGSW